MDNFSVTQFGKPLDESLYTIDLENKVFSSGEDYLVLDFTGLSGWTLHIGHNCTLKTANKCTLNTGRDCTFDTCDGCTFQTDNRCTFHTGFNCIFKTGTNCTFKTGVLCTFDTLNSCTFLLYDINTCKFKSYDGYSIILDRRDNEHYLLTEEFVQLQKIKNG